MHAAVTYIEAEFLQFKFNLQHHTESDILSANDSKEDVKKMRLEPCGGVSTNTKAV